MAVSVNEFAELPFAGRKLAAALAREGYEITWTTVPSRCGDVVTQILQAGPPAGECGNHWVMAQWTKRCGCSWCRRIGVGGKVCGPTARSGR